MDTIDYFSNYLDNIKKQNYNKLVGGENESNIPDSHCESGNMIESLTNNYIKIGTFLRRLFNKLLVISMLPILPFIWILSAMLSIIKYILLNIRKI